MTTGVIDKAMFGGKQNSFAGEDLGISITSKDGRVNKTVYVDDNGDPFEIPEGGRLDVLLLFGEDGTISAKMRILRGG